MFTILAIASLSSGTLQQERSYLGHETAKQLAHRFLPGEIAGSITEQNVWQTMSADNSGPIVDLYSKPAPSSGNFCVRMKYRVRTEWSEEASDWAAIDYSASPMWRRDTDCSRSEGKRFFHAPSNVPFGQTVTEIDRLYTLRESARAEEYIDARLTCRDEIENQDCTDDVYRLIAELPLERLGHVQFTQTMNIFSMYMMESPTRMGGTLWEIEVGREDDGRPHYSLVHKTVPPF